MARSFRHTLIAALLTLHTALLLCGTGLHAMPGMGHDSGLRPFSKNDHSHGPGKSSHEAADDCPVCQFLAQGQLGLNRTTGVATWFVLGVVAPTNSVPVLATLRLPSVPRGPPRSLVLPV